MPHLTRPLATWAAVTALAASAALVTAGPAVAAPTTGTITGVVTTANGTPLQGVTVLAGVSALLGSNNVFSVDATTRTGPDGSYRLTGVPTGSDERVQFVPAGAVGGTSATGYGDLCFGGDGSCATSGKELTIRAGRTTSGINGLLSRAGIVQGRLTDAYGRGVGSFQVFLFADGDDQSGDGNLPSRTVTSDADGNYVIPRLYAHSWAICFGNPLGPLAGTPSSDGYVSRCRADRVAVTAGSTTTLATTLVGGGAMTGRVVDPAGHPIKGAVVGPITNQLLPPTATTGAGGRFFVAKVAPGQVRWCVSAPRYVSTCDNPPTVKIVSFAAADLGEVVLTPES